KSLRSSDLGNFVGPVSAAPPGNTRLACLLFHHTEDKQQRGTQKPDRAETFQEVWIFLLQHARKVTGFVAIF
ncbi:hypothetical protein MJI47_29575, partial [Salmonella enterica subsp. enterica serovar Kentucky]|nr:hypothetical protein [Salmonella enterica subsp. enterica serovar Kentucky]